jgi:site-specific DNA-methyltransferase (adenine-specific)
MSDKPTLEPATLEPASLTDDARQARALKHPEQAGKASRQPAETTPDAAARRDGSSVATSDASPGAGTLIAPDLAPLRVPIDRYQRHPGNPRRHPHLEELRASYRRWGQYRAIVVQAATGYIVAGNGLLDVMTAEGADEIAASVMELDDREAKALLLADNRLAELGAYDQDALARMLDEQDATGDLAGTGYSTADLDRLMRGAGSGRTDIDDAPPLTREEPTVQAGELYQLGRHRLYVGDATDQASWARLMGEERADCIWTDPPYGVGYYGKTAEHLRIEGDEPNRPVLEELLDASFALALAHTAPGRGVYCASPGGLQSMIFLRVLERHGVYRQTIVWVKDVFVMGRSDYHYRHELVQAGRPRASAGGDHDARRSKRAPRSTTAGARAGPTGLSTTGRSTRSGSSTDRRPAASIRP